MSKRQKRKIKPKTWYIVQLFKKNRKGNLQILRQEFSSKKEAEQGIKLNFKGREIEFDTVKGVTAIEHNMEFAKSSLLLNHIKKYKYPENVGDDYQSKKSYRTKLRRKRRGYKNIKTDAKYKRANRRKKRNGGDN